LLVVAVPRTARHVVNVMSLFHQLSTVLDEPSSTAIARLVVEESPIHATPAALAWRKSLPLAIGLQNPIVRYVFGR